jgi:predicted lipid-binding transport protein (Tim44 family)
MGGDSYIDILLFAVVAVFIFVRLRQVLGRRTGEERQRPNPFAADPTPTPGAPELPTNVVRLSERVDHAPIRERAEPTAGPATPGVQAIRAADPEFHEDEFLGGARAAFEMIVNAFARGDVATLRPLLAPEVMGQFEGAIRQRDAAGHTLEAEIAAVRGVAIAEARMDGATAAITVRFATDQVHVMRDREGRIVEGEAGKAEPVVDLWTFTRDLRSRDPNWQLAATRTEA